MKIISVCNQKGGCAKTTTVINVAAGLAYEGNKVLVIDNDYQANLTTSIGFKVDENSLFTCFKGEKSLKDIIKPCVALGNLDIVPSNLDYSNADIALSNVKGSKTLLKELIEKSKLDYDYILIDCAPSLNLTVINALVASDSVIIPMEPSLFNLQGLGNLIKIIKMVQKSYNSNLKIEGIVLTRVDSRTKLGEEFKEQLQEIFPDRLFKTQIHQSTAIVRSQIEGLPICLFDEKSKGAKEYFELVKEILNNGKEKK